MFTARVRTGSLNKAVCASSVKVKTVVKNVTKRMRGQFYDMTDHLTATVGSRDLLLIMYVGIRLNC